MKELILQQAKQDIPLYFNDFKKFWDETNRNISDEDLYIIYRVTLIFKNYKYSLHTIGIETYDLVINEIFEDINSSFFLAMLGLYRSAHMHLRSSIELSLQLLYFIHHPIEYHLWKEGNFVIKHDKLISYFQNHPNFTTNINTLLENITHSWKLFSKHIHGEAPIFFQCEKDARKTNSFAIKDFNIWKSNYTKNIYYLNKLFLLFFKNDLSRFPHNSYKLFISLLKEDDMELIK